MSDGYQKQRLTNYLNGAREGAIGSAGDDWKARGAMLEAVSEALMKKGPELSEKLGKDSLTAAELKSSLLKSAQSMNDTGGKLKQAGDALVVVGDNLEKARISRKAMKTLVEPPPYTAPSYNGVQPTPEQIQQVANQRAASNTEHNSYQTAHAGQEAEAAEITANLDQAFLSAIPAMVAIHGGPDPTAPTPGHTDGPGSDAPPPVNRPRERGGSHRAYSTFSDRDDESNAESREREERERERQEREKERREREDRLREERAREERERLEREHLEHHKDPTHTSKHPTTNVAGGTDSGATYQGVSDGSSVSGSAGSTSAGVGGAAAAGAAGAGLGAGAMKGGAVGGSAAAPVGGTVRGIGAGGPSASSSFTRGSNAAGSPTRASSPASAGGRGGAGRGSAGRTGAAASTSGKGSAKGKSTGLFRRGATGSTSGGRSNKLDDERNAGRDALVYEQDWLGDETAAPSVLD